MLPVFPVMKGAEGVAPPWPTDRSCFTGKHRFQHHEDLRALQNRLREEAVPEYRGQGGARRAQEGWGEEEEDMGHG